MGNNVEINGALLPIEELHLNYLTHLLRHRFGFMESSRTNVPVNNKGELMPLYTYPCYEWLHSIDWFGANVFEFGVGYSSLWWAEQKRVNLSGVEDTEVWAKFVTGNSQRDVDITTAIDEDEYIGVCSGVYDVIVVDGKHRTKSAERALKHIKNDGIIILDNSEMYVQAKEILDKSDMIPIHFHGFKPIHVETETTSCYIGRAFSRKPRSIVPMGGTDRTLRSK